MAPMKSPGSNAGGGYIGRREVFSLALAFLSFWVGTLYSTSPTPPLPSRVSIHGGAHHLGAGGAGTGTGSGGGGGDGSGTGVVSSTTYTSTFSSLMPFPPPPGSLGTPPKAPNFSPTGRLPHVAQFQASTYRCETTLPLGSAPARADIRSPDFGGPQCVFEGLYLRGGKLYFAVEGGESGVAAATATFPQGYHFGHDMNVGSHEAGVAPTIVPLDTVKGWSEGGVAPPLWSPLPLLVFSRLNPKNIYHHLWDDQMFAHSVLCPHVAALAYRGEGPGGGGGEEVFWGCSPGVVPPFALALVDSFGSRDQEDWAATVAKEVHVWPLQKQEEGGGGNTPLFRVGYTVMGTKGLCTHRRHCSNIMPPLQVQFFRRHLQALHGIVTHLPTPGTPQTAVLIRRTGRRVLTNLDELVTLVEVMGFKAKVVGPLKDMTIDEQYQAFVNASLAIFVFGAELGPAWVGLPEGSCTAVLHPAGIMDTLSYWIADKVGLKVATVVENFKTPMDPRLAPRSEWVGRESAGLSFEQYSDVWLYLFNHDFRMDPKDLWRMIWCANQPWPPD